MAMTGRGGGSTARDASRGFVIGLIAFLTLVDLFAAQAILPSLREKFGATPAAMSAAVNACTIGMAAAGLLTALFGARIDQRRAIAASLAALALPTLLLAHAPDLATFAALRIVQGLCMAAAFTMTLTHLGARTMSRNETASAFAAYVTGNVASNLFGRILSSAVAESFGLQVNFYVFAILNLAGAALALAFIAPAAGKPSPSMAAPGLARLLANGRLRRASAIGFCILFAFIGVFTFVSFVLAAPPLSLNPMRLGLVYLAFLPSIATTLLVGSLALRFGTRRTLVASFGLAAAGLPLLLAGVMPLMLLGLSLVAVGTFAAQAIATGHVGEAAPNDRAAANGLYLASYFCGGLVGTAILGQLFDRFGWEACIIGVGAALAAGLILSLGVKEQENA